MTWSIEIERARGYVEDCKARCAKAFPLVGTHPESLFWQAHGYHYEVQQLRAAEEQLRLLEQQQIHLHAANETDPEVA